jgi:hypothetical protein
MLWHLATGKMRMPGGTAQMVRSGPMARLYRDVRGFPVIAHARAGLLTGGTAACPFQFENALCTASSLRLAPSLQGAVDK